MKTILVVEDDSSILRGLRDNLQFEGYEVLEAKDGNTGLKLALEQSPDLLLLDIMLPGMNGHEICRKLKSQDPNTPIIMITARDAEMDKVSGLDLGADDYITKPFSIPELMARIRAVLRRYELDQKSEDKLEFGSITIDFKRFQAFRDDEEIRLTSREFDIMRYFAEHRGEVVHRHDLLNEVWGYESLPTTRTVDNFILDLRKKLEDDPANPKFIISVRGVGYRFNL
jgi:DNA-binding response OmpR family regulator